MYQIFGLRPVKNKDGITIRFFKRTIDTAAELFQNISTYSTELPQSGRYNVFFTVYQCAKGNVKQFKAAEFVGFDIDGIAVQEKEAYLPVLATALGVDINKCPVILTGNGLHVYIKIAKSTDKDFFAAHKGAYIGYCDRITAALKSQGLPGEADSAFFAHNRGGRLPGSENIKGDEGRPMQMKGNLTRKEVVLINSTFEDAGFKFEGEKKSKSKDVVVDPNAVPDADSIMECCSFLKNALEKDLPEPEWYVALGITCYFHDNNESSVKISEGHPTFDREETIRKAEQFKTSSKGPAKCESISKIWKGCTGCKYRSLKSPLNIKGKTYCGTSKIGFTITNGAGPSKRDYEGAKNFFSKQYNHISLGDLDRVYIFNGKHYEQKEPRWIKNWAQENFFPPIEKEQERSEFLNIVKSTNYRTNSFLTDANTAGFINLQNGVYDIKNKILHPHSTEFGFTSALPYNFESTGNACPTWDLLLDTVTCGRKHLASILEEFLGYCLLGGSYTINAVLILAGQGSNGKTTLLNAMKMVLGQENCSSITIGDLAGFNAAMLENKLANFSEEEPPSCFKDTGSLKKITGNSSITVRNVYEKGFDLVNRAKIIMSYNKVPYLGDTSLGMRRRLLIVPFDVNYEDTPDKKIENVEEKIKGELPAIFLKGIAGLQRLQARGKFLLSQESKNIIEEMVHDSDAVQEWFDGYVEITGNGDHITFKDAYTSFRDEMELGKENRHLSYRIFTKRLRDLARKEKIIVPNKARQINGIKLQEAVTATEY